MTYSTIMENYIYNDGGRATAGYKGNTEDCVCRAISICTGKSYQEVYDFLAINNSNQRRGKFSKTKKIKSAAQGISTKRKWFHDYMVSLGFEWTPTMLIGQGCKTHLKSDELPKGKLVVSCSRHMVAVIDGVINDTHDCSRNGKRCVYGYYKLVE